jgi:hypothetical protein
MICFSVFIIINFNVTSNRKSPDLDKINLGLTMAKAVHFRTSSRCFVLNGIDISSRFEYDRKIIEDTCRRFHDDINTE